MRTQAHQLAHQPDSLEIALQLAGHQDEISTLHFFLHSGERVGSRIRPTEEIVVFIQNGSDEDGSIVSR